MQIRNSFNRRQFLTVTAAAGAGLALSGCSGKSEGKEQEVSAVEDLMREHGVLRRALFIYSETAARLRKTPADINLGPIAKTASLFRSFGEDYHEKQLEEAYIFPAIKKTGGSASAYPDILIIQHNRGRQITDYISAATSTVKPDDVEKLASILESFVRMYRPHAAIEDTIIFPTWKKTLTSKQLDEMGDKFEDIEHKFFGEDGFEKAVRQIADIEAELGLADLSQFTPPPAKA